MTVSLEKPQTPFTGLKQNFVLITVIYISAVLVGLAVQSTIP